MYKLAAIFKTNWKIILLSYGLYSVNLILTLVYPKVLGDTIDHLMIKDYNYVIYLILLFGITMGLDYVCRIYDIRVFSGIYRKFASVETHKQLENDVDTTKINGRLTLMNGIVQFFEYDVISVLRTIFGVIVSIYFLSLVSWIIVLYLVLSGILLVLISFYFSPKLAALTKLSNDIYEEQTDIIAVRKIGLINNLLRRSYHIGLDRASINAKFNVCIEIVIYFSVTSLLIYYVMNNQVTVGSVFSTYRYMFDFCNALLGLPGLIVSFLNIKDIIKRLDVQ